MKQQLDRILSSDISTYKVAVTQRIQNLEQIDSCLSERSCFLQDFQEMLRKQMQKANVNIPQQFSRNSSLPVSSRSSSPLKQSKFDHNENKENGYLVSKQNNQYSNITKNLQHKKTLKRLEKMQKNYFCEVRKYLTAIREEISLQVSLTKDSLTNYIDICLKSIGNKISELYELKIQGLLKQIQELKKKNSNENLIQTQINEANIHCGNSWELKRKAEVNRSSAKNIKGNRKLVIEIDDSCHRSQSQSDFISKTLNKQHSLPPAYFSEQTSNFNNDYFNSLEIRENANENQCQFSFLSSSTIPMENSMENKMAPSQNSAYRYYGVKLKQNQKMEKMTLKNNKEPIWKHFTCDFSGGSSELSSEQKSIMKKRKTCPGSEDIQRLSFDYTIEEQNFKDYTKINLRTSKNSEKNENEPSFPSLLKKNLNERSYDIPFIRSLVVSYPPIEEGFSTLKFGNQIVYRGMWRYRKFHGKGKLTLPEYIYEGQFKGGQFDGRGTLKVGPMEFIGEFKDNKVHGQGKLKLPHKTITGKWRQNSILEVY